MTYAMTGKCSRCGQTHRVTKGVSGLIVEPCGAKATVVAQAASTEPKRSHFNSVRTTCSRGHNHPSKVEARVCADVYADAERIGSRVFRNVRLPLFALAPTDTGASMYATIDFCVVTGNSIVALIDAKSGRVSRDWARGRAAVEATYGVKVLETDGKSAPLGAGRA